MKTTLEILEGALAKIEAGWTQGAYARDSHGDPEYPNMGSACRHCAMGGLLFSSDQTVSMQISSCNQEFARAVAYVHKYAAGGAGIEAVSDMCARIVQANDMQATCQSDVVRWFKAAIEDCKRDMLAGAVEEPKTIELPYPLDTPKAA